MKKTLFFCLLLVIISCKENTLISAIKDENSFGVKEVLFNESRNEIMITLSNNSFLKYEAPEPLYSNSTNVQLLNNNNIELSFGDDYGNHVSMFFNYSVSDTTLYLNKVDTFFPFKQDTLGRGKFCLVDGLNEDIRYIDDEELFERIRSDKYCELRKY